jgi:hypothetical protein
MKHTAGETSKSIQDQLNGIYMEYLDQLYENTEMLDSIDKYELSSPLFLSVDTDRGNYVAGSLRMLFVGKETNGWFNPEERRLANLSSIKSKKEEYLQALVQHYRRFNLGYKQRMSALWRFLDIVKGEFSQKVDLGFLWTNLIRHDYLCKAMPFDLFQKIDFHSNQILRKEIEILKPDILIFLTGPSYDWYITHTFTHARIFAMHNSKYSARQVAVVEGMPNVKHALRIYHPSYHDRLGAHFKREMSEIIFRQIFG